MRVSPEVLMTIKKNSIVRRIDSSEVYEVVTVIGNMAYCVAINLPSLKKAIIPFSISELEVLIEEETDIFNLLFRNNDE